MMPEPGPFDTAIVELQNRIRPLQEALNVLLAQRNLTCGSETAASTASANGRASDVEVQHDSFFGMTIGDAAKKYLSMMKVTKSTADIAGALERGGLKHTSKDFPTTVRSILGPREDFTRVPNGDWGLAEWYAGKGRGKKTLHHQAKPKAKASGKKSPKKSPACFPPFSP
jgi:hypothetical protein